MRIPASALSLLLLSCWCCLAQQVASTNSSDTSTWNTTQSTPSTPDERRARLTYLQQASAALKKYLSTVPPNLDGDRMGQRSIQDLDAKLESLIKSLDEDVASASPSMPITDTGGPPQSHPEFFLSVPSNGRTNISTQTTLTWTEDMLNGSFQDPPLYNLKWFHVVIAKDEGFRKIVAEDRQVSPASAKVTPRKLAPKGLKSIATAFTVRADLELGTKYYWRVFAVYTPPGQPDSVEFEQEGKTKDGRPNYFITAMDPFQPLTKRNFSLQRTVDSTDPTEGAQFSFLKTFGGKTVYTSNFAFFWDSTSKQFANRGYFRFRPAVEGKLTSDKSKSEDAWRFSGSAVVDYNFIDLKRDEHNRILTGTSVSAPRKFIDGLYFELGGSLESDQGFDTKKLASRLYFSPSSRMLAIGTATGHTESSVQFMWRPSFEFNAGHTFANGDSAETGKTILRMVPKVRMTLYTRSLSRLLKVANSSIYVDNTFYYLPNDQFKKQHNFFTSGFELLFMKNFGFGLTYKNGESAPRFKRVNSFGGILTVRFGPE